MQPASGLSLGLYPRKVADMGVTGDAARTGGGVVRAGPVVFVSARESQFSRGQVGGGGRGGRGREDGGTGTRRMGGVSLSIEAWRHEEAT